MAKMRDAAAKREQARAALLEGSHKLPQGRSTSDDHRGAAAAARHLPLQSKLTSIATTTYLEIDVPKPFSAGWTIRVYSLTRCGIPAIPRGWGTGA